MYWYKCIFKNSKGAIPRDAIRAKTKRFPCHEDLAEPAMRRPTGTPALYCGVVLKLLSQRIHHPSACHFAGFQYKLPSIPFAKTFRGTYRFRSQRHTGRTSHHAVAAVRVVVSVNCSNAQMQPKSGDFYTLSCFQRSSSSSKVYGKCGMFRTS